MWARKRPDIGWQDLATAAARSLSPTLSSPSAATVVQDWFPQEQALLCFSVRSGLDLLLQALQLPPGSEVILSAITIHDILRVIEHHRLVPVPVDVEAATLDVSATAIENAITEKSRLIVVAHLFGSRIPMAPITRLASQHGLLLAEDCAQAFAGREYAGNPASHVSLFSFGPIKTATALGGAVVRVRDQALLHTMQEIQDTYPHQSQGKYLARVAKYAALKIASAPGLYGVLERSCRLLGVNHDRWISRLGRNLGGLALLASIRQQPCAALQWTLARRIQQFETRERRRFRRRTRVGRYLSRGMTGTVSPWAGHANASNTYWVLAAKTTRAKQLTACLRRAGFDATMRSSLCNGPPKHRPAAQRTRDNWLAQTVFIPCDPAMPALELRRLRRNLREFFR